MIEALACIVFAAAALAVWIGFILYMKYLIFPLPYRRPRPLDAKDLEIDP